jgi:outer membrane autotransporter protein
VYNSSTGGISASASVGDGTALATGVNNYGFYGAYATNEGSVSAAATNTVYGVAVANGVVNVGYLEAAVVNDYHIDATASAYGGLAQAQGVYNVAVIYDATVTNAGDISATASVSATASPFGVAYANGVMNFSLYYGYASTVNSGNISASAEVVGYGLAQAQGVYNLGYFGSSIENSGSILASGQSDGDDSHVYATGAYAYVIYGDGVIQNHGDISAVATSHGSGYYTYSIASGAVITGAFATDNTATLYNDGTIGATATVDGIGFASATGASLIAKYAAETNYNSISAIASAGYGGVARATGVTTAGKYASSDTNYGSISAEATTDKGYAVAKGVVENSYYQGSTTLINFGDISASAYSTGHADTQYGGRAYSYGVTSLAKYDAIVTNSGTISAVADASYGAAKAFGVILQSAAGSDYDTTYNEISGATLTNDGDIYASATGHGYYAIAVGAELGARYSAQTYNNAGASITAVANGDFSTIPLDSAYYCGAKAVGSNTGTWGVYGEAKLVNHGDISASASASAAKACVTGSSVLASIVGTTTNDGRISAYASAADGIAIARGSATYSLYEDATLQNDGIITAAANAGSGGAAYAYGGLVLSGYGYHATTYNGVDGVIRASAVGGGDTAGVAAAIAVGSITAGGYASLVNYGDIGATATATGYGDALAMGAVLTGVSAGFINGFEYFYWDKHNVDSSVYNGGDIRAAATAEDGVALATGVNALSQYGNVTVDNAGRITAAAYGADATATAVSMTSAYSNTLTNTGSIVAGGDGTRIAVWSSDDAIATIVNAGTIAGSIRTGMLDDTLVNHAGATLVLDDATVDLGAHSGAGNTFANDGTIVVNGDSSINMGSGLTTLVPSLNPLAFANGGVIDFRDGAADDLLTLTGDLDGDGQLYVDVSSLASDVLYVDGSVVDGSVHTINVNWLDVPKANSSAISVVSVSGDATADNFVLGHVATPQGLLTMDFALVGTIDASNATPDVFSVGVEVTGLSDAGVLATSIAPGAQSLLATQVGTWRQRMGVISQYAKEGLGAWARMFQTQGTIAPELVSSSFGDVGHFAFDQKNTGTEVGVDFALSNEFSVGLLLAKAEGTQHLNDGVGSSQLKGDTSGVYATWISPNGFYVDGSYRAMDFTAKMTSAAGAVQADGDAASLNVEMGYAWTWAGGLKVEPQVQYTQTHVSNVDVITIGQGALQVADGDATTGRVGVMVRKSFGTGTVWTPYASLNAVHEFDGRNGYAINDTFFGATSTEGTSALVEAGVSVQAGRLSVSGGLNWQDGGALQSFVGGQLGVRYSW